MTITYKAIVKQYRASVNMKWLQFPTLELLATLRDSLFTTGLQCVQI